MAVRNQAFLNPGCLNAQHFARLPTLIGQFACARNRFAEIRLTSPDTDSAAQFFYTLSFPKLVFEAVNFRLP